MPELMRIDRGITLLSPWWAFILWAGKNVENRAQGTGARLRGWRGLLALTASKAFDADEAAETWEETREHLRGRKVPWQWSGPESFNLGDLKAGAGHLVGVAELVVVCRKSASPWAVDGQDHLVLGHRWAVDPIPFSGARGIWHAGICSTCKTAQGREELRAPCRKCKAEPAQWLPLEVPRA